MVETSSLDSGEQVRRRRCDACKHLWYTLQSPEQPLEAWRLKWNTHGIVGLRPLAKEPDEGLCELWERVLASIEPAGVRVMLLRCAKLVHLDRWHAGVEISAVWESAAKKNRAELQKALGQVLGGDRQIAFRVRAEST